MYAYTMDSAYPFDTPRLIRIGTEVLEFRNTQSNQAQAEGEFREEEVFARLHAFLSTFSVAGVLGENVQRTNPPSSSRSSDQKTSRG